VSERPPGPLIITGAAGYIGQAVVEAALHAGHAVVLLARRPAADRPGVRQLPWRLGEPIPAAALDPASPAVDHALIHLAHDWSASGPGEDANLTGSRTLRDSGRALGLGRQVFVSSLSARPDALNRYGRAKWAIEQVFDAPDEVSLRVGLVYGGPRTAMYGLLCRIVGLTSVLPMIRPRQAVQPIHRREVAEGVLRAVTAEVSGPVGLAGADAIRFADFLDMLARRTRGGRVLTVPLPLAPVLLMCRIVNAVPVGPKVDEERVLGLAGTRFVETRADLARLGLVVRPFADGMADEPVARRRLLAEGQAVLGFVLRARPGGALVRRYARAVRCDGPEGALPLAPLFLCWPALFRWIEPLRGPSALRRRLDVALALAEASPEGERALSRSSRIGLFGDLVLDALAMPVRLAAGAFAR